MAITKRRFTGSERTGYGTLTAALVQGDMVAFNPATGKLRAAGSVSDIFAGTLTHGGAADEQVEFTYNECIFVPYASAVVGDVGKLAYALTVDTMDLTSDTKPIIGRIMMVEASVGFWIDTTLTTVYNNDAFTHDSSGNRLYPSDAGDSIQTGDEAAIAAVLVLDDNKIASAGTGTNIDIVLDPKGTGSIDVVEGKIKATGAAAAVDIALTPKGAGVVTNGVNPLLPYKVAGQGTTGTAGTAGQIAVPGMTANGVVIATLAEDPGAALSLSDVVAGVDIITVYTRNSGSDARAALSGKKVNYLVLSY